MVFKEGDSFGELALIQDHIRTFGVKCIEDSELYCMEGEFYRGIISEVNKKYFKETLYFLSFLPIFSI